MTSPHFKDVQPVGRKLIRAAKAAGYMVGVRYEDGDLALTASAKNTEAQLMEELYACSSGTLFFYDTQTTDPLTGKARKIGAIFLVHVNGIEDAICDHTDNRETRELVQAAS